MVKPLEKMTTEEFAYFFQALRDRVLVDPLENFVKAPGFINFTPTPGQTVLLKNVFGQKLDSEEKHQVLVEDNDSEIYDLKYKDFTETELYEHFTGFSYEYLGKKHNRINLLCGRRSGKSTCASIIALYTAIKLNWREFLKKTPVATIAILSHSVEFSREILEILRNLVDDSPILSRLKDKDRKDTQSTFHLKVPFPKADGTIEYSFVAIKVGAASKKTTRGRAVCTLIADEACWWNLDENSKESDVDVFRAIRPALLQFGEHGTIIKLSSPAIKTGVMYDEWQNREALKDDFIQLKAPSWMMNNILPKEEFIKEYKLDPDGFETEYRANFIDSISNFILPEFVDRCTLKGQSFLPPSEEPTTIYSAAIDAAFKSDRFAFSLVGHNGHRLTQYELKTWDGNRQEPVKVRTVAKYIRKVCMQFGITQVHADQYAFQPMRELFAEYGITLVENTFSIQYKRKIYFALKRLIHNENIDLLDYRIQQKEIKELVVEKKPSGQISIGHPVGSSDDCADALAVSCYVAMEKAGNFGVAMGEIATGMNHDIPTDISGRAFKAPAPEMLGGYSGFENVIDSSHLYKRHPETGKLVHISELEEESLAGTEGPNFLF